MNEEAINDAYSLFKSGGYNGSLNDFVQLISTNQDALNDAYTMFASKGYNGDVNGFSELMGLKKKEPSVSTSQEAAMEQPMATGSSASPKSAGVSVTAPTGQQATVEWGPTEFKASQDAPMYDMASLSDIVGNVDVTIDEATKQKISNVVGITGAVFNKIVNPQSNAAQALADAKKFADNTQTAYNVGALSAQINNNMADEVPDYERVAKLKQQLKNEQPKLLSSQLGAEAGDFFDMLAANPVTFLTEVLTTSATQMTGGAGAMTPEDALYAGALGLATGGFGASAYMSGKNSLNAEMSSRILDALEERGVDVTNAEQLRTAMTNPELMMDVKSEVQAPASIVGALDAISAGLAGRFGKPLVELAIQAGAGAVGEAGAQIAEDGRITSPSAILTEMVAELPGGLIETAFGAKTKDIARKSKVNQEIKEIESELAATEDPEVRSVLETALNAKRNEKNKIFTDYADFVNSLPEEEVARLNALNGEIVKVSNAINSVTSEVAGKALRDRRQALLDEVAKIEETVTPTQDAVQEQATDEGVLRPEQPEVGLQEVVEGDQELEVVAEEGVEEEVAYEAGTIGTLLNERVSYSDPVSGETVEGDLFVDGQRVVLEAAGGQQFDLGNVDEILGLNIEEAALVAPAEMAIIPQEDGSFVFNKEGDQKVAKGTTMFNRQPGLQAIRRDAEGNVDRVTLYSEDGAETYNLTGQEAEDAAYYIVRGFVETQEGQDAINQLAQRNEEARRDLSQPLGSRAVQQAAPQAPAPVRAEAPAGPAVEAAVEDDIQAQEVADLAAEMQAAAPTTVERLNRVAERARKAISKVTPDVKIIVHDTDAAYREASGDTEQGVYIPATKTIHINASKATPGAVAHEVFHAVFLDRVKTDVAAQRAAKKMVESLKRVVGEGSELYQYLDAFSQNYDANFQNEEKLAELAAVLAENYMGLETSGLSKGAIASFKQAVKDFINTIAKRFGIPMPSTITDADVIATLNAIAQKTVTGDVITEADVMAFDVLAQEAGVSQPIGEPSEINALPKRNRKEAKFSSTPMPLSFVTSADKVDVEAVIKDAQEKNLKVWFWMADQLGRGEYYDENINGTHYLDAGPSFALDPQNRDKGVLWASGLQRGRLEAMVGKADLIFFISGSPQKAKLFNKKMVSIIEERVNAKGGFQKFKADVLAASKKKGITEPLRSFNSFEDMRNSAARKNFIIEMLDVQNTPTTELFKVLTDYGVFFDPNELRDGFYLENGFEANDIMLIGKPTGIGGKAAHSTYETEILGEVIGVPDKVINAWDVMPQSVKDKYAGKELSTTQKTKIISPDAGAVITPSAQGAVAEEFIEMRQRKSSEEFKNWSRPAKSIAQRVGHAYNMNHNGFVQNTIDPAQFKSDVERIDKRLSIKETSTGSGYYMTLDGKFFNPYKRVIGGKDGGPNDMRQRINSQTTNIFDIVETARAKGYTDKTIELYLKQEGFDAAEIKNALAVASGLNGAEVPVAFGYVQGGMAVGQSLFSEIQEKLSKLTNEGADKATIRVEAQRLLMDSEVYKAQNEDVQAQLRLSLDASIGTNAAARAFSQEFKELRAMRSAKKRAAKELNAIKAKVRGFIRKNLPQGEYSKADVVKLLKAIVDANPDSLPLVIDRVQNYVTEFKVRNLESQIKKLLATKTTKIDSGRVVGITTIDVQEDLAAINDMLIDDGMSEDNKQDLFSKQVNEYQTLNSKYDLTDEDIRRLQLLEIANPYNEAMLLDDDNPVKVESLTMARDRINIMITVGRSEFKENQKIKHQQQKKNVVDILEAITGKPVPKDITDDGKLDEYVRDEKTTEANVNALKSRISKVLGSFAENPLKAYFNRGASLSNLLGQITANLTDMFGGPVNEMVYDKIKQSDIEVARRELVVGKMIESKLKDIYGEDYNISVQQNKIPQIIDVFKKERAVEARRLTEEMKTASPGRKSEIMLELTKMRVFDPLSQNKIYYLYNQFKSQENRAGLETNYGENYVEYLNELFENHLDPKVREWADWQVDVLFPELYDAYNPVYVEIFKTNMPWTANYGGRVYRKGDSQTDMAIPLMNENGKFATIQTPSSTKARKQNKNAIQEMDGDLVLDSYIKDMEYFRAYGVTIRDISRIFKNEAVRIAVKKAAGEDVLDLIDGYIKIVGTNGMSVGTTTKQGILDSIDSNLGISYMAGALNQMIKQTTSAFLFAPRVGINNWIAYTAKAAPNLGTVWNEFIDNAPRIVKRYNPKEMSKIMNGYDSRASRKLAEAAGVGNNRRALKAMDSTSQAVAALMWPVTQGDKYSSMVGGMGNYLYYKDMYMEKNPGATNEQAIKFAADKVSTEIEQILGSSSRVDRDSFQNSGSTLFRALSFLSNSPKAMIRNIIPAYSGLFKKVASFDRTAGQGTLKQNLETVLMFQVFVPVLFKWAAIGLPGLWREWRDEDDEELGAAAILGPFEALLIVGPLLTLVKDRILDKPWADDMPTIPIYDLTEDLFRQVNKIIKAQTSDSISNAEADELREDALLNISYIIAGGFGIPAKNIDRMIRNIGEVIDGNEEPGEALLRLFNYSDYTIEGPDKKKK